jgi:tryptophan synthase alpha chain
VRIGRESHGFVYCLATYGVTGSRDELAATSKQVVAKLRPITDRPLLVGVGIGTPAQAAEVCGFADGVIVGSALMARVLDGDARGVLSLATAFRASTGT